MNIKPLITNAGDQAITLTFGKTIDPQISSFVFEVSESLRSFKLEGILDIIPSYCSVMIQYDPIVITSSYIYTICKELCSVISLNSSSKKSRIISVPVLYEKEYAPDIEFVSTHTGLSINEIIKIDNKLLINLNNLLIKAILSHSIITVIVRDRIVWV